MKEQISELLANRPGLKAREIAKSLQLDRTAVNSCLYENKCNFKKDDGFRWSLSSVPLKIEISLNSTWLDATSLESNLKKYPEIWSVDVTNITFIFPDCNFFISTLSRFLALVNQLAVLKGKVIELDFSKCKKAFTYLCRAGWFDLIDKSIKITPTPIKQNDRYGQSHKLMEFASIDAKDPDDSIPIHLKQVFIAEVGKEYSSLAFAFIAELFDNVREHANSSLDGFAALQVYRWNRTRIQTVISDSGEGIVATLRKVLATRYPALECGFSESLPDSDALLVKYLFEKGNISSALNNEDESRGLGLKCSGDIAAKFNATICIRQENFELTLYYRNNMLVRHNIFKDLVKLKGTHICFDFYIE